MKIASLLKTDLGNFAGEPDTMMPWSASFARSWRHGILVSQARWPTLSATKGYVTLATFHAIAIPMQGLIPPRMSKDCTKGSKRLTLHAGSLIT